MTGKRDLSTAREWGREILKTHELEKFDVAPQTSLIPIIDVTQVQADAQPRKMTISGVINSAIQAGIIDAAGGGGGSGITAVVQDTTPQLGGDLDVNGQSIVSTSNQNVKVAPDGTGVTEFMGSAGYDAAIQLNCEVNSHGVKIKSPPHSAGATYTLVLPVSAGISTAGQALRNDGSGNLYWG